VTRWLLGDVVVDLDAREVRRSGRPLPLSPKAFELLGILVASRPTALSKQDLQERLWPDTFVVEKNLTNLISEIRAALGDDPVRPRFIRTVPRFGYACVSALSGASSPCVPALPATVPTAGPHRHNLPDARTSFIGRERELAEIGGRLASTRLLTLTGVGGGGKTRLALELARRVCDDFEDGVWLVDLAALSEPALIAESVASALDLRQQSSGSLEDVIASFLRPRRLLLLVDNCEHLIGGCARLVDTMLTSAPRLVVLATSREPLGVDGEVVWPVPPLSLPETSGGSTLEAVASCEAVRLFLDRAASVDPTFRLTRTNAAALTDLCRHLDGVPLALELAAARLNVLSIEQILDRIADRFALLSRESYTALPRQRALEASVEWSYDLLAAPEQALLRCLSVFAGGWTLDAAEQVCSGEDIPREQVLPVLASLVNKSLVAVDDDAEGRRYRFLETVRQYASRRLHAAGDADRVRERHFASVLDLARRAEPEMAELTWLNRLRAEHDNVRAALDWSLSTPGQAAGGLELAAALVWFWVMRGSFSEGQRWLERATSANPAPAAAVQAKALTGLGDVVFFQGDFQRASRLFDEAAARGREAGRPDVVAHALGMQALACFERQELDLGAQLADQALAAAGDSHGVEARGPALSFLAYQALAEGDADRSASLHEQLADLARSAGHKWGLAIVLFDLALVRLVQRRAGNARVLCAEAIALWREFGDARGTAWSFGVLAGAEAVAERPVRAATLLGVMEGLCESAGTPAQPSLKHWVLDRYFGRVQQELGTARYQQLLEAGRAMPLESALSYAFEIQSSSDRM
jgi:non-specific serine/threonine protein kinase